MREDDLTDVIAAAALEGFLLATSRAHVVGERLCRRAIEQASAIDMYKHKARAFEWHARTLVLVGQPDEDREAAATAVAIYQAKGDVPAAAWARELVASLEG